MDESMEIEEVTSNSSPGNPSSKESNGNLVDIDLVDNDSVTKLKTNQAESTNNIENCDTVNNEANDEVGTIIKENDVSKDVDLENSALLNSHKNDSSLENHVDSKEDSPNDENTKSENLDHSVEKMQTDSSQENGVTSAASDLANDENGSEKLMDSEADKKVQEDVSNSVNGGKDHNVEKEAEKETSEISDIAKKKEESGKKKKGKTCVECGKKRKIEFRIHFQGKTHCLCSEQCYKQFKEKQSSQKSSAEPKEEEQPPPLHTDSFCPLCQKLIFPNQGYYPVVGEIKPLCSEDCVRKYQDNNGPPRKCSQCKNKVEDSSCHLTWETMVFCSEDCLGKYQSFLGSHCTCCQAPVQQASLGKYCVCFGSDIRQFCSGSCLDDFKKGLKVCTFCQTDLSAGTDGFLAPVGDKGQFKDFCSQACMERYEVMNNLSKSACETQECAHCKKQGTFKIQVPYNDKKYFLCCDNCVAGLRCTLRKTNNVCASCHQFFKPDPSGNKENDFNFKMDGLYKFFCSKTCMTTYVLSHRRITQCLFCKVKKYNFDMIEKIERNVSSQIFCSLNCMSLYRVNVNAASSKNVRCDNCSKTQPALYHLTMSDGSVRNFCQYSCVLSFQNQFTSVPALTTTSMTRQVTTPVQTLKTTSAMGGAPVIANVVSLASQPKSSAPPLTKPLVPQTLVTVRPQRQQPVTVFTTKPQVSSSTAPAAVGQPTSSSSQVMREVIVQPPAPKSVKNKTVWCKPIMQTKGVSAKTAACHKAVQTDDNPRPIILPVPVPVYVPTPLHMFSRPVPCPVPFPVPIPIPIIIPSSKDSQAQIMKQLRKFQRNLPSNSNINDTLGMEEKSTEDSNKSQSDADKQSDDCSNDEVQTEQTEDCDNDGEDSSFYIRQTKNQKRALSPHKHEKHKKMKLDEDVTSEESRNTLTEDENSISSNSQAEPPFQQNLSQQKVVFETPSFNFDEEEQSMLKVP